jgi:hypothetical protein
VPSALEVGLAGEHHEDGEARVEPRLAVQRNVLEPEVRVYCLGQLGEPEPGRAH